MRFAALILAGFQCFGPSYATAATNPQTPLTDAVLRNDLRTLRLLLASGEPIDLTNRFGFTPLLLATALQREAIADVLLKEGADPNRQTLDLRTSLLIAATNSGPHILKGLIQHGAALDVRDPAGLSAADLAALFGNRTNLILLQKAGAPFTNDLVFASALGDLPAIDRFLRNGGNPNLADYTGFTPLAAASANGHLQVVKRLFQAGADFRPGLNLTNAPLNPILQAARNGHRAVLEELLRHSKPLDGQNLNAALIYAVALGQTNVLPSLLKYGANPNALTSHHEPVLCLAAQDCAGGIAILLDAGAAINATNQFGATPLICAAYFGNLESVRILLNRGARMSAKTYQGFTALQIAEKLEGRGAIIKLLCSPEKASGPNAKTSRSPSFRPQQRGHLASEAIAAPSP
jgi:ankyrin repeat protein